MTGAVFMETLRRGWRGMLWWGIGIGSLAFLVVIIVPNVEMLEQMADLMETLPPILIQALGGGDVEFMATPEGYLTLQYFGYMLLVFGIYAVIGGLNVTANDEERGTMDIFLSLPIARWRLILEKFLAYSLLLIGVVLLSFVGMWLGIVITPAQTDIDMGKIVAATVNQIPGSLLVLAFTLFVTSLVRRRGLAIAIAAVFIVGGYFLDTLGRAAPDSIAETLSYLSLFRYYDAVGVIQNGLNWGNISLLLVVTALLAAGGMWLFERRDVGL